MRGAARSRRRQVRLSSADVFKPVGERVAELDIRRRSRLLHVVAGDAYAVEFRHVPRGVGEDVADDPHRRRRRVYVGVADHEFFQDVVLDGAGEHRFVDALFLGRDDVEGEDGKDRAVHRHGDGHLPERDAGEEYLHVEDGVDGDARLSDVSDDARMIGVVAAVCREVEGDGEPLLSRGEVAAVEGVALFGGGEARVLTHCPGARDVHGGVGAAQEGRQPRRVVEMVHALVVGLGVERGDFDLFHCAVQQAFK